MLRTKRLSEGPSWPVWAAPRGGSADSPAPANDAEFLDRSAVSLSSARRQSDRDERGLLRTVKATASWAARETLFGFAIYGACYCPCPWTWELLGEGVDAVEALYVASHPGDAPEWTGLRRDPPMRLVDASTPASARRRAGFTSRLACLWSFLAGSARAGE